MYGIEFLLDTCPMRLPATAGFPTARGHGHQVPGIQRMGDVQPESYKKKPKGQSAQFAPPPPWNAALRAQNSKFSIGFHGIKCA
mmetsp:Transcript_103371/g.178131  ORF Transcript_103371/g.178131 Transcript_103371/m.178131 type:complete len:84 (-) Transcript_103371:318-569(-)